MRVRDEPDVVGRETERRELGHDVVARPRLDGQPLHPLGAQARQRIEPRLAVHAGVEQQLAARMAHQKARHRHGPGLARLEIGHHAGPIELDVAGAERVDVDHGHPALAGVDGARRVPSTSKDSGNVFDTHSGPAIRMPGARSPVTAKLIAMRWSSKVWTSHGWGVPGWIVTESHVLSTVSPMRRSSVAAARGRSLSS